MKKRVKLKLTPSAISIFQIVWHVLYLRHQRDTLLFSHCLHQFQRSKCHILSGNLEIIDWIGGNLQEQSIVCASLVRDGLLDPRTALGCELSRYNALSLLCPAAWFHRGRARTIQYYGSIANLPKPMTHSLVAVECQQYLHMDSCSNKPWA